MLGYSPAPVAAVAAAVVYRRQHFLVRCLGIGAFHPHNSNRNILRMESVKSGAQSPTIDDQSAKSGDKSPPKDEGGVRVVSEADAGKIIRLLTPTFDDPSKHKGEAGVIGVIGGCREYTGAPYFSAISALKLGADLSHVFCTKDAAPVIKGYSPELIVHPVMEESYNIRGDEEQRSSISKKVIQEIGKWLGRFDCLVIGPGLGRDQFLLDCVSEIMKTAKKLNIPMVIDGDGLFLVTNCIDLVRNYPLAVLTPNFTEYKRLVDKVFSTTTKDTDHDNGGEVEQLVCLSKLLGGVTILRKGHTDLITDGGGDGGGDTVSSVSIYGSPRRVGGQGDILSGSVGLFLTWARKRAAAVAADEEEEEEEDFSNLNPTMAACIAASALLRRAALLAFQDKKRATLTSNIIEYLSPSLEEICPSIRGH